MRFPTGVLFLLPFVVGILLAATRGPLKAPAFADLAPFVCDPRPISIGVGRNRGQTSPNTYFCASGKQQIYQRSIIPVAGRDQEWIDCIRSNQKMIIWRPEEESDYGSFVFQSACGGKIYADYGHQASSYNTRQLSGTIVACLLMFCGACGWGISFFRRMNRR